jgi:CRP-like cAMP-binding protein
MVSMDSGALLMIARQCRLITICEGELIITAGEIGLEMYIIIEGVVQIQSNDGIVLATLEQGNAFGEMALLA